jgi:tetratricopeptide (TPR) repeat protein
MIPPLMAARFCPQCGTSAVPNAKFCIDCGTALDGRDAMAAAAPTGRWQLTSAGLGVLAFFVVGGLGIWAAVLSPEPPTPGPGRGAARAPAPAAQGPQTAQADLPADHPKVPIQIPPEVKTFIDDLAKKASAAPDDLPTWGRLAQVYYRTAQVDPAYYDQAEKAFAHVLERDENHTDALRGLGSIHFERDEPQEAIALYDRYLAIKPDDQTVRTALGASYVSANEIDKAIGIFRDVIAKKPDTWPAHYYLGVALDQQGDRQAGLAAVRRARELATEDPVRRQIDETLARMGGAPPPSASSPTAPAPTVARTPFQTDVEQALRAQQILGPRIVRFDWPTAGAARVVVQSFPMSGMPDAVKEKFTTRVADTLREAAKANPPGTDIQLEIADAQSGEVMATIKPSPTT